MTVSVTPVFVGTAPEDGTGDPARTAFQTLNSNEANFKAAIEALQGRHWTVENASTSIALGGRYNANSHAGTTLTLPTTFATSATAYSDIMVINGDSNSNVALTPGAVGDHLWVNGSDLGAGVALTLTPGSLAICSPRVSNTSWDVLHLHGLFGTKAEFDVALTDGSFAFDGGAHHNGFSDYVANEHIDWTSTTANLSTSGTIAGSNVSGTNTGDQTSIVGISGTTAEFNTALSDGSFATGGGTATGTNTGDQTTIVGITGTKAEFDTAVTDGNFAYSGGAFHNGFSDFIAAEHINWSVTGVEVIHADRYTDTVYTHPSDGVDPVGAPYTGATVFSDINVNAAGHVTGTATRDLTYTDVGAAASSHNHTGLYEPVDATIVRTGDAAHDGFSDYVPNEHIDWTSTTSNLVTTGTVAAGSVVAGNPTLTVDNTFYMSALSATIPALTFDASGDYFAYNRATNTFTWAVGSTVEATLSATSFDLQSNSMTTTGSVTASSFETAHGTHPVANLQYQGQVEQWEAGATVTAGYLVMLSTDTVQNEVVHATDQTSAPIVGIAITGGAAGATLDVLVRGTVRLTGAQFTSTSGTFCYASSTAGYVTPTVTTTTGDFVKIAGYCIDTDVMFVNPQWNFVEVA
jgi:hypothetical protein